MSEPREDWPESPTWWPPALPYAGEFVGDAVTQQGAAPVPLGRVITNLALSDAFTVGHWVRDWPDDPWSGRG